MTQRVTDQRRARQHQRHDRGDDRKRDRGRTDREHLGSEAHDDDRDGGHQHPARESAQHDVEPRTSGEHERQGEREHQRGRKSGPAAALEDHLHDACGERHRRDDENGVPVAGAHPRQECHDDRSDQARGRHQAQHGDAAEVGLRQRLGEAHERVREAGSDVQESDAVWQSPARQRQHGDRTDAGERHGLRIDPGDEDADRDGGVDPDEQDDAMGRERVVHRAIGPAQCDRRDGGGTQHDHEAGDERQEIAAREGENGQYRCADRDDVRAGREAAQGLMGLTLAAGPADVVGYVDPPRVAGVAVADETAEQGEPRSDPRHAEQRRPV